VKAEGEDYGYAAFAATVDVMVVGRGTYDAVLRFGEWPWAGKRVVVMTRRPCPPRADETFFEGTPEALVAKLAAEGARRVYVDGGIVIRQFLGVGLVDDLTISTIPIVLGDGIPLFAPGGEEQRLALVSSRAFPTGLVQSTWRAVR